MQITSPANLAHGWPAPQPFSFSFPPLSSPFFLATSSQSGSSTLKQFEAKLEAKFAKLFELKQRTSNSSFFMGRWSSYLYLGLLHSSLNIPLLHWIQQYSIYQGPNQWENNVPNDVLLLKTLLTILIQNLKVQ